MNYTFCERLMWFALAGASFRVLRLEQPKLATRIQKRKAKSTYKAIIARTPEIGTLKENPLRICLAGGAVWLSLYESSEGKLSETLFAKMVEESMRAPLVVASFKAKRKTAFTIAAQKKRQDNATKNNTNQSPCNWNVTMTLGRNADEYTLVYHSCGLCGLGRQEGLFHLVKYLCVLDFASTELMGGTLFRTKTLASGGDCCDFYVCRKGSRWEQERLENAELS